jgi:uncharacterized membrane protein YcaP (DUF421 family)
LDPLRVAVRALAAFIYLLIVTRASGKRSVAQATPFDFLVSLIIGDLIDDALWAEVSISRFAAAAGTVVACDVLTKTLAWRSRRFYRLADGIPSIVLRDGVEDGHALRREQLNEGDLAHLLRLNGISRWIELRLGILERDHTLSVIRHEANEPLQRQDAEMLTMKMQKS